MNIFSIILFIISPAPKKKKGKEKRFIENLSLILRSLNHFCEILASL